MTRVEVWSNKKISYYNGSKEDYWTVDIYIFNSEDLIDGYYLTRKGRGDIPSAYSYECKICTIKRIVKKRKSNIKEKEWYYPDW